MNLHRTKISKLLVFGFFGVELTEIECTNDGGFYDAIFIQAYSTVFI